MRRKAPFEHKNDPRYRWSGVITAKISVYRLLAEDLNLELTMQKIRFFCVNGVYSVYLLYKNGQFSFIPSNKSITSIPIAPKLHPERRLGFEVHSFVIVYPTSRVIGIGIIQVTQ